MKKLNLRKIRWSLREVEKGDMSIYQIAKQQKVSERWVRQLPTKYAEVRPYKIRIHKPGRKPKPIPEEVRKLVLETYDFYPMGAVKLEKYLLSEGRKIPHNKIHKILTENGKSKTVNKKIRRKKWVRYEKKHSNSLWHTDYCEVEGKQIIAYIDDCSRYIVGY